MDKGFVNLARSSGAAIPIAVARKRRFVSYSEAFANDGRSFWASQGFDESWKTSFSYRDHSLIGFKEEDSIKPPINVDFLKRSSLHFDCLYLPFWYLRGF